jgi:hypothetical protein
MISGTDFDHDFESTRVLTLTNKMICAGQEFD